MTCSYIIAIDNKYELISNFLEQLLCHVKKNDEELKCWRQMVMDCCLFSAAGLWLGWLLPRWCASCPQAYSDGSNGVGCI